MSNKITFEQNESELLIEQFESDLGLGGIFSDEKLNAMILELKSFNSLSFDHAHAAHKIIEGSINGMEYLNYLQVCRLDSLSQKSELNDTEMLSILKDGVSELNWRSGQIACYNNLACKLESFMDKF